MRMRERWRFTVVEQEYVTVLVMTGESILWCDYTEQTRSTLNRFGVVLVSRGFGSKNQDVHGADAAQKATSERRDVLGS